MAKDIDLSAGTYYSVLVSGSSTSEVSVTEVGLSRSRVVMAHILPPKGYRAELGITGAAGNAQQHQG